MSEPENDRAAMLALAGGYWSEDAPGHFTLHMRDTDEAGYVWKADDNKGWSCLRNMGNVEDEIVREGYSKDGAMLELERLCFYHSNNGQPDHPFYREALPRDSNNN